MADMEQVEAPVSQNDLFTAGACLFDGVGQQCPVQNLGAEIGHYLAVDSRTFAAAPYALIDSISSSADAEDVIALMRISYDRVIERHGQP